MPQFDKITFFNQIFWLFILFSGFYFILLKTFLPKLSSILKARAKKLQKGSSGVTSFSKEQDNVNFSYNNYVEQVSNFVKSSILNSSEKTVVWLESSLKTLNKENIISSNSLLESSLHKKIVTTHLFSKLTK